VPGHWTVDDNLSIEPFSATNIHVTPARFKIENVSYQNFDTTNNFTYLSNLNQSRTMASTLTFKLLAVSETNTTLQNYTDGCYAEDFNVTLAFTPTVSTIDGVSTVMLYDDLNNTVTAGNDRNFTSSRFQSGKANLTVFVNFDRNSSRPVKPFEHNVTTISAASSISGSTTVSGQSVQFYYGRLHAPDYTTNGNSIVTPIYAEVYSTTPIAGWSESQDDVNWWVNRNHAVTDGNITGLRPEKGFTGQADADISATPSNAISSDGIFTSNTISYGGSSRPHETRIFIDTQSWLKYHRYITDTNKQLYYNVTFTGNSDWAGVGHIDSSATVQESNGSTRRIEW
jgi:hypothetical protein